MSDTDSDDEFLSADEGEGETSTSQYNALQEEEVDEIMDILMNNKQASNKNPTAVDNEKSISIEQSSEETTLKGENKMQHFHSKKDTEDTKKNEPDNLENKEIKENDLNDEQQVKKQDLNDGQQVEKHDSNDDQEVEQQDSNVTEETSKVDIPPVNVEKTATSNEKEICKDGEFDVKSINDKENTDDTTVDDNAQSDNVLPENVEINNDNENVTQVPPSQLEEIVSANNPSEKDEEVVESMDNLDLDDEDDNEDNAPSCPSIKDDHKSSDTMESEESNETNLECNEPQGVQSQSGNDGDDKSVNNDATSKGSDEQVKNIDNCSHDAINNKSEPSNKLSSDISSTENEEENLLQDIKSVDGTDKPTNLPENECGKTKSKSGNKSEVDTTSNQNTKVNSNDLPADNSNDGWGWDNWADDFIIQAAGKVSTILETVEGQLGIPDPTAMAQVVTEEEKQYLERENSKECKIKETVNTKSIVDENEASKESPVDPPMSNPLDRLAEAKEAKDNSSGVSSWFSGFSAVSSLSGMVQNTGSDLVSGGIGALEFIGKKTVDMLSEGDPGLRTKRDLLAGKNTNSLSATLREAKSKSELQQKGNMAETTQKETKFVDLFEKYQGNAHLDALEMLSSECDSKLTRILNIQSATVKEENAQILSDVRCKFELDEDLDEQEGCDDFKKQLFAATKRLKLKVTCSKVLNTWTKLKEKSNSKSESDAPKDCFDQTLASLAELSSRFIEFQRKVADMLMLTDMQAKDMAIERASALKSISQFFVLELTSITNACAQNISAKESNIVTDIYLEGSNCVSMIKDCHELLLPILQCSVIK